LRQSTQVLFLGLHSPYSFECENLRLFPTSKGDAVSETETEGAPEAEPETAEPETGGEEGGEEEGGEEEEEAGA
jgi:hypothetical protein